MNSYHLLPPSLPPPYHLKALKYFNSYHLTAFLLQNIVTRALSCFEEGGKVERGGKAVRDQARHPLGVCPVLSCVTCLPKRSDVSGHLSGFVRNDERRMGSSE